MLPSAHFHSAKQASEHEWDAIVVGAGMGGCAAAFALAKEGMQVLVIENGLAELTECADISKHSDDAEDRARMGRWPTRLSGKVDNKPFDFYAPLGTGVGGSSLLYAAALDRFRPSDFTARAHPNGGTLQWPFNYEALVPYYEMAEDMMAISGTADPLSDTPVALAEPDPLSPRDSDLFDRFAGAGLHPYLLHSGYRYSKECGVCFGRVCLCGCKKHGGNSFFEPAVATGRVAVLSQTRVDRFDADADQVKSVYIIDNGTETALSAKVFVLSAGTYFSPVLLLKSRSDAWPNGLGNHNDQVGRNLMFHTGRSLAVWARRGKSHHGGGKTLVFRDFYETPEGKFGEVQSTGAQASYGNVVYALRQILATSAFAKVPLLWQLARIPAFIASRFLGKAAVFELIMEDLPYPENRVTLDDAAPSGMRFDYQIQDELRERFALFSRKVSKSLSKVHHIWLTHGVGLNYGHPMGTCRMGSDPKTSVASADGRVHGLGNLYIADGAALPSSGGTNPSLTIAACALRLGAIIAKRHHS